MTTLYYPPTTNGLQKTLDAQLDQGTTASMTLNNTTGVQNKPGVVLINRIDSDGTELSASVREFVAYTGTSGSTLTTLTRGVGGTSDQDHAVGSVVEFILDITWGQAVIDALNRLVDESDLSVQLNDANDNELVTFTETASAVNELTIKNEATGSAPRISATGDDTNIDLELTAKGTGSVNVTTSAEFDADAYFDAEVDNGNSGTADTIDFSTGNKQKSTLTDDCTFTFTAPGGPCNLILKLVQDGTGSRTVTWPGTVKWPSGTAPTLTTDASAIDIVSFYYDGTNYYGQSGLDFS